MTNSREFRVAKQLWLQGELILAKYYWLKAYNEANYHAIKRKAL